MIVAPINGLNLVLHFFRQELNSFLLMPFTMLVPNTYSFQPKWNASLYLVYPGIRFLLYLETPSVSLSGYWFITGISLLLRLVILFSILLWNASVNAYLREMKQWKIILTWIYSQKTTGDGVLSSTVVGLTA